MTSQINVSSVQQLMREEVIDLRQYWRTLMRYKWGILGFGFVTTLLAALVVFSLKPTYRATATVLIETQQNKIVSIEEVYGLEGGNSEYLLTQFEIIKSRKMAEAVVSKLNLMDHPEFNQTSRYKFDWQEYIPVNEWLAAIPFIADMMAKESEVVEAQARLNAFIGDFQERISIEPIRKTQLVKISFEANDAGLAAEIANAIGQAYIESTLQAKLDATMEASTWLNGQLAGIQAEKKAAEERLQAFLDQENLIGENGGGTFASRQLDLVANKMIDARRDRMSLESVYRQIQSAGGSINRLELVPGVLQDPTVQQFKNAAAQVELKRSELAKRYGPKHPKMIAVESELDRARTNLSRQVLSVVNGIKNDYQAALASERSLESTLEDSRATVQNVQRNDFKRQELEKEVEAKTTIYDTFLQRFNETNATADLSAANARIVDPAVVPVLPVKPNKKLIVALALVASLGAGVMFAFLLESLNNTLKTQDDVENKLGATLLGILPLLKATRKNKHPSYDEYLSHGQSSYSESVRTIRTGLVLSAIDEPHKRIAVTSTIPGEGKTSLSLGLAYAHAQMENVLLIDADMRRPSLHRAFSLGQCTGLADLVANTSPLNECIYHIEAANLDVLPAGTIPPNPLELLSSKRFAAVLEALSKKYDRIIIDTAPAAAVSDSLVLSRQVDAMLYVVKSDSTTINSVRSSLKRLEDVKAPVTGVVLNQVNVKHISKYYGSDYSGYYDNYGYTQGNA